MKDFEILFYLSAIMSFIGMLLLAYVSPLINPPLRSIEEISYADIEKNVYVEGIIKEINKNKDRSITIKFYNTTITCYIKDAKIELEKDYKIRILGTVKIYKGGLEILVSDARNIKVID